MDVSKSGRTELTSRRKTGYSTNQDWETTKQIRGEHGVSGILKRGRQCHATLCLSLDTSGTDCRDYKSELSDRVPESARRNSPGIQDPRHFVCPYSTTPRDFLGWDTHKTKKQRKHKENKHNKRPSLRKATEVEMPLNSCARTGLPSSLAAPAAWTPPGGGTKPRPHKEPETGSAERQKDGRGDTARKPSCPGKCVGHELGKAKDIRRDQPQSLTAINKKEWLTLGNKWKDKWQAGVTSDKWKTTGERLKLANRDGRC